MEVATMADDIIMEEREELMVSPDPSKHHNPTRKIAQFLKPSANSQNRKPYFPDSSSVPKICSLQVSFNGWRTQPRRWKDWVDSMHSLHKSTWKKAGIYDAVLNSSYEIKKSDDLILRFAEKWCSETKSFHFDWGEVTMTLEDIMILGGYSVLGDSVINCIENDESKTILAKLQEARSEIARSKCNKVEQFRWMCKFKNSGSEIEHEAFLILWLTRFVFPKSYSTIAKNVSIIAIYLAKGIKLALAPAVLASIYKDLSLLKTEIVKSDTKNSESVTIWAPFQLVQIWIWERFLKFSPNPGSNCSQRFAKWDKKKQQIENIGPLISCVFQDFCWQPYGLDLNKDSVFCKIYQENRRWVRANDGLDEEFEVWARCVRVSELVGINGSCIEQYLPHRVAMQFGMSQDVPADVARTDESPEIAWRFYTRSIKDVRLCFPSRVCEPYVTLRYLEWWKKSTGGDGIENLVKDDSGNEDFTGGNEIENLVKDDSNFEDFTGDDDDEIDTLGLELEARINKLEEVFEYLKGD